MKIIRLFGMDAIAVAMASNRQLEVREGVWKHGNLWRARKSASRDPESVRLIAPARPLLEDLLGMSIPVGQSLLGIIRNHPLYVSGGEKGYAVALVERELS